MAQSPLQAAGAAGLMAAMGMPTFAAGGGVTGGAGGNAGPSSANMDGIISITPAFDASNWTVSTGSSKASASNSSASGQPGAAAALTGIAAQASGAVAQLTSNPMILIAAVVIGVVLWKRL